MAIPGRFQAKAVVGHLVLGFVWLSCLARCTYAVSRGRILIGEVPATPVSTAPGVSAPAVKTFDVTAYGAIADGETDNVEAFMQAWIASCRSGAPAKLVFPPGTFLTGPLVFAGPCNGSNPMIVEVQGTIKATTDISEYSSQEWILFESIDGLKITGSGTFHGQGEEIWKYNDCSKTPHCTLPPTSIKLNKVRNGVVEGISSVNSKGFHFFIVLSYNIRTNNLNITAPNESPNTDGVHLSQSDLINITNSIIRTGDDCVSIGHGSTNISVSNITCGPGHGISVGSLGKYPDEKEVNGIFVNNCTIRNTTNGVRIKTWGASPPGRASRMVFQNIIVDSVKNPIIIDQTYGSKKKRAPSQVKVSDIQFKNIKGTTISVNAVSLHCSSKEPCEGIKLEEIDIAFNGSEKKRPVFANSCINAKFTTVGKQNPPACVL